MRAFLGEILGGGGNAEEKTPSVKSLFSRLFFSALLMLAVFGYFLDLECLVNECDEVTVAHSLCVSPVVMPDAAPMPVVISEFNVIPMLLVEMAASLPPAPVLHAPLDADSQLRPPPELLLTKVAITRRGPPSLT